MADYPLGVLLPRVAFPGEVPLPLGEVLQPLGRGPCPETGTLAYQPVVLRAEEPMVQKVGLVVPQAVAILLLLGADHRAGVLPQADPRNPQGVARVVGLLRVGAPGPWGIRDCKPFLSIVYFKQKLVIDVFGLLIPS